ncbi:PA1571 family protein [Pseudomonas sp. NPDC007930]|uniref:PA1571 family protein n=1 Tax=Pseudomonas sp. NPDC007930 TaxID=3364417 RepID=UPI0036ECEABD
MSLHSHTEQTLEIKRNHAQDPVGGAIIDADGREVPITEQMVRKACQELEKAVVVPAFSRNH